MLEKRYTDLREVSMREANELIGEGFHLLFIANDRYWEKAKDSDAWGMRSRIRYVVGREDTGPIEGG